jgi:opacity protein-like surface antigen
VKKRLRAILGLAAAGLCGAMAFPAAAENPGWYAGGEIGLSVGTNQGLYSSGNGVINDYNTGFAGGIIGGYSFADGLRPEGEFGYRTAGLSKISVISQDGSFAPTSNFSGHLNVTTFMGNLWYDFRAQDGLLATLYPYVGGGVGFANVSISNETNGYSSSNLINGSGSAIAFQLGFGAEYEILSYLSASVDLRYLMTSDYKVSGDVDGSDTKLSGRYRSPSMIFGVKYKFGGQS